MIATLPLNENERLQALKDYNILDSLPEADYDNITRMASEICGTSVALISFIDDKRQWFKSSHGIDVKETPRDFAFCTHAILNPNEILIVPDSRKDERFAENPLVTGDPHVIFYAGVPLINRDGFALGSLCVVDTETKVLNENQISALKVLARHVIAIVELRKANKTLKTMQVYLEERNSELERLVSIVTKEVEPCFLKLSSSVNLLHNIYSNQLNNEGKKLIGDCINNLDKINSSLKNISELI